MPNIRPNKGERMIENPTFNKPGIISECQPAFAIAAPTKPPIRACEELVGMPKYQVMMSQKIAPQRAAKINVGLTISVLTSPVPMVVATCNLKNKKAMKLKKAAQIIAQCGLS